jgi:hypothetical protein
MQLVLNHKRLNLWNVDHLMAMRFWILTAEYLTSTAAGGGEIGDDFRALLRRKQVAAGARMPLLPAALAARTLALFIPWGLETRAIARRRLPLRARPSA